MVWVERDQAQEISIAITYGPGALAKTDRIDLGAAGNLQVLDRFPSKAGMAIKQVPIELAQPAQRCHDLFQIVGLETKEHVLKLGAVEI